MLRNYQAQLAIDALTNGDDRVLRRMMSVLQRPYNEQPEHEDLAGAPPGVGAQSRGVFGAVLQFLERR